MYKVPEWILFDVNKILSSAKVEEKRIRITTNTGDTMILKRKDAPHAWLTKKMDEQAQSTCHKLREALGDETVRKAIRMMKRRGLSGWMCYVAAIVLLVKDCGEESRLREYVSHAKEFGLIK